MPLSIVSLGTKLLLSYLHFFSDYIFLFHPLSWNVGNHSSYSCLDSSPKIVNSLHKRSVNTVA